MASSATNAPSPAFQSTHPSRGAWIEMIPPLELPQDKQASHPSRGAWIEIALAIRSRGNKGNVAPLAGCVD